MLRRPNCYVMAGNMCTTKREQVSINTLREFFIYKNGELCWKKSPYPTIKPGLRAGGVNSKGYRRVKFRKREYGVHRIIWALHNDRWPTNEIDHIDCNPLNNRIENLREATRQQNSLNRKSPNRSLPRGVWLNQGNYSATIKAGGGNIHLGSFDTPEEASEIFKLASEEWYGSYKHKEMVHE